MCFAMVSCEKIPRPMRSSPVSIEISEDNWAEVTFTNYSQNAASYVGIWRQQHKHG